MSEPGMWLEIRRGKTNFPLRPVSGDRFLIGAGSHCHLQLGGDDVPMLHSLLVIEGKTAHLEAVVAEPPLLVNGEACRMVELQDEDLVAIGEFEFVFHRLIALEPVPQAAVAEREDSDEFSGVPEVAELSVAELVELIEEETLQLIEFSQLREQAAGALLDAAHRISIDSHPISVPMAAFRTEPAGELTAPLSTESLPLQAARLAEREAECQRQVVLLQAAQQQLAAQMAEFAKQIANWQNAETRAIRRAIA